VGSATPIVSNVGKSDGQCAGHHQLILFILMWIASIVLLALVVFSAAIVGWVYARFQGYKLSLQHKSQPIDIVLVLGGDVEREEEAARWMVQSNFQIPIYLSSPADDRPFADILKQADMLKLVKLDTSATDTVTNFTSLCTVFQKRRFKHALVVTSDYHVDRSKAVGQVILNSMGVAMSMHSIQSTQKGAAFRNLHQNTRAEPNKLRRDLLRAWIYVLVGLELSSIGRFIKPERFRHKPTLAD
jgi:hypothetical protein